MFEKLKQLGPLNVDGFIGKFSNVMYLVATVVGALYVIAAQMGISLPGIGCPPCPGV